MRNPEQPLPDHAAILATLQRSSTTPQPGGVVRVSGPAGAGPEGVLTAPLSGRPCVWFRVVEWRHPVVRTLTAGHVSTPAISPTLASDMALTASGVTDYESPVPFTVGGVLVDPVRADVDAAAASADTSEGQFRASEYILRREWLIAPETPVFAVGAVAPGNPATLRATPADCVAVSVRGEQQLVQRAQSTLAVLPSGGVGGMGGGIGGGLGQGVIIGIGALVAVVVAVLVVVLVLAG